MSVVDPPTTKARWFDDDAFSDAYEAVEENLLKDGLLSTASMHLEAVAEAGARWSGSEPPTS
jgi:hypothetical protein